MAEWVGRNRQPIEADDTQTRLGSSTSPRQSCQNAVDGDVVWYPYGQVPDQ